MRGAAMPTPKILYGVALQRLGRPVSAERMFAEAARLAPRDPEAQTAAAVGLFPGLRRARLRGSARLDPRLWAATVRFHLGLCLLWLGNVDMAKRQLLLARKRPVRPSPGEANDLLERLEVVEHGPETWDSRTQRWAFRPIAAGWCRVEGCRI